MRETGKWALSIMSDPVPIFSYSLVLIFCVSTLRKEAAASFCYLKTYPLQAVVLGTPESALKHTQHLNVLFEQGYSYARRKQDTQKASH